MNITKDLIARVEAYRETNKNPCKNYATEAAAEKVAEEAAQKIADYFEVSKPCRYVVVFNPAWGRWIIGFDMTEMLSRPRTGGYLGIVAQMGHFSF